MTSVHDQFLFGFAKYYELQTARSFYNLFSIHHLSPAVGFIIELRYHAEGGKKAGCSIRDSPSKAHK